MSVGDRIRERLTQAGISQAELARRVQLTQPTINALIKGNSRSSAHLHKIARELHTTPAYLTGETDDPDSDTADYPLTREEQALIEMLRGMEAKDRSAILTLARTVATSARSPTVHDKGLGFQGQSPHS